MAWHCGQAVSKDPDLSTQYGENEFRPVLILDIIVHKPAPLLLCLPGRVNGSTGTMKLRKKKKNHTSIKAWKRNAKHTKQIITDNAANHQEDITEVSVTASREGKEKQTGLKTALYYLNPTTTT